MAGERDRNRIPVSLKLVYTSLILIVSYTIVSNYGWMSMLWFSHTALLVVLIGMWWESRLLLSMASLSILLFHSLWTLGFLFRLVTGATLLGGLSYMFDADTSLFLIGVSLYHVAMPLLMVWILRRKGYRREALKFQTLFGWTVAITAFMITPHSRNINWVFGPIEPQTV
ncbi:MAG: membrane-associated protein, partial [Candidatus Nanohaloarchaea archaeon]|nr:membrane-associated protein [Candidatus Nanohaloarchaea archaeon]